jgi:hypothetical protein
MTRLRLPPCALVAVALAAGCGARSGGASVDGGRDGASMTADVADVRGEARADADADSDADAAPPGGSDARGDAADAALDVSTVDAAPDAQDAADAPPDAPGAADAPPTDVAPWVPRDASHEVAPLHETRPTYQGSWSAVAMGDQTNAVIASDGSIYVAGSFRQPTDFDPGPAKDMHAPVGSEDAYITKLGADGSYVWTLTFGGPDSQTFVTSLVVSGTAVVVAGAYTAEVDFDPGPGVQKRAANGPNLYAGFVLSLTRDGAFRWESSFVGSSGCTPDALALDDDGSIYGAGAYDGECDFDPGPGQDLRTSGGGNQNGFLVKLGGGDGSALWAKTYEGDACTGSLTSVTTSSDGLVWATGGITAGCSLAGRAAPAEAGDHGAAIFAITPDGTSTGLWAISGGDGMAIVGSPDGFVYVGGYVAGVGSTDFDPGPGSENRTVSPGDGDPTGFVLKLGPGAAFRWVQLTPRIQTYALAATDDGGVIVLGQPVPDNNQTVAFVVTKRDPDSSSPWGIMCPGTNAGAFGISAGRSGFVLAGETGGAFDVDPGAGVDAVPANASFVSRYSF